MVCVVQSLLSQRLLAGGNLPVELGRFLFRDRQCLPLVAREVARKLNNLSRVIRIVCHLAIDRLHDGMRLGANGYRPRQIRIAQRLQGPEEKFPPAFPHFHQFRARCRRRFKFSVAISVRLFSIAGKKIRPARAHVPGHVFHDDRYGIGFRIQGREQPRVRALGHRPLRQFLVIVKYSDRIFYVRRGELVCHTAIFFRFGELSSSAEKARDRASSELPKAEFAQLSGAVRGSCKTGCRKGKKKLLTIRFFFAYYRCAPISDSTREEVMTIGQMMLGEFDQEMQNTRKTLERWPDEKGNWKPHEKSGTVGWLAGHIATMPGWTAVTLTTDQLDYAPVDGPAYQPPKTDNRKELLAVFEKNVAEARTALASVSDQEIMKPWKLLAGGKEIFTMPRVACLRGMIFNHIIHHRAQLTVYYRLLGIPVPVLYGPSADEGQPGVAEAAAN